MENESNISGAIKNISKSSDEVYAKVCEVIEVNSIDKTIDVKPIDDTAEIFDVRLQADSENKGLLLMPKVGSMVVVVFLNKDNAVVVNTSEITNYELEIGNCKLIINEDGFLLKKENETLKSLMGDLLAAIQQISFTVSTVGSATAQSGQTNIMNNLAAFVSIENRFNQFLK